MTPADMKAHLAAFFDEVWNRRDLSRLDRHIAPSYRIYSDPGDPWDGKTLTRAEFAERVMISCAPFPDQEFTVVDFVIDGARIVADWRWTGAHLGDIPGFPASGRRLTTSGITIYAYDDRLICGHRQQTDRLSIFKQLAAKV